MTTVPRGRVSLSSQSSSASCRLVRCWLIPQPTVTVEPIYSWVYPHHTSLFRSFLLCLLDVHYHPSLYIHLFSEKTVTHLPRTSGGTLVSALLVQHVLF